MDKDELIKLRADAIAMLQAIVVTLIVAAGAVDVGKGNNYAVNAWTAFRKALNEVEFLKDH